MEDNMSRSFIRQILESIKEDTISFAGGLPSADLFPVEGLKETGLKAMEKANNFQYSQSRGILSLREKIAAKHSAEGFCTKPENILITSGSQQGLYVLAKFFEGRNIVIEAPSYLGAVNVFRANNVVMAHVALHENGVDIDEFKEKFDILRLAYLIPDFQNPTGRTYDLKTREQVAMTVRKTNGFLIEDAPYSDLYFSKKQVSISSMAPYNSFYLGSFSKTLAPGLRIGWIRADKELIDELVSIKETMDLHSCGISQHILDEFLGDKEMMDEHLEKLREGYRKKMQFFENALTFYLPDFKFSMPDGGMFIYGRIDGVDTSKLVQKCIENNVVFVPGSEFYTDGRTTDEIRFNFTHSSEEQIVRGIKLIKSML